MPVLGFQISKATYLNLSDAVEVWVMILKCAFGCGVLFKPFI